LLFINPHLSLFFSVTPDCVYGISDDVADRWHETRLFAMCGLIRDDFLYQGRGITLHKYIIMGVQGCGKGTQAKLLKTHFDLVHISVGDILRWHIQDHTKLGARIKRSMKAGELVSDEVVEKIIHHRLEQHDWNYGFILDGFPRNRPQAEFFLESYEIDAVLHIELADELVLKRILSRRLCERCGLDYNLISHRPQRDGVCDVCGGDLIARADDSESSIRRRIEDYHKRTAPTLDLFRGRELILTFAGQLSREDLFRSIAGRLERMAKRWS
jgi:adenylate kinase